MNIAQTLEQALHDLRQAAPLVVNVTNDVVTNLTANALLALGASPAMSAEAGDAAELAAYAAALVVNMGTPSDQSMPVMFAAAEAAFEAKVPLVLDPVACGATSTRRELAARLLARPALAVVRGNASEIMALAGTRAASKGVDSLHAATDAQNAALELAAARGVVVVVSGETDLVATARILFTVRGGSPLATRVTGMGCTATAVTGAFCAVCPAPEHAALAACCAMKLAAETAMAPDPHTGPAAFQTRFLDALYHMSPAELAAFAQANVSANPQRTAS